MFKFLRKSKEAKTALSLTNLNFNANQRVSVNKVLSF